MPDIYHFFQMLVNGLNVGSTYALIAIGYTMVYGIIGMINFAHGEVYMIGSYVAFIALAGLAVLCGFVLVRAVGFHHVDRLISMDFANVGFNFWFENAGLAMIAVNALVLLGRGR